MTAGLEGKGQPECSAAKQPELSTKPSPTGKEILFSLRHRMADSLHRIAPRPMGRMDVLERQIHMLTEAVAEEMADRIQHKG